MKRKVIGTAVLSLSVIALATLAQATRQQPSPPCHPNATADMDMAMVGDRGDIRHLPGPLRDRLVQLAGRPHSQLPTQAYAEAHFDKPPFKPKASQLFQYYLLDTTGFEANPFTSLIPGVNDTAMLTATGPDCGLPTIGSVRVVLEPKPGLPTDPNDVRRDRKQPGLDGPRGLVGVARTVQREEGLLVKVRQVLRVRDPGAQEAHELRTDVVQQGPISLGIPTLCVCHPLRAGSRASLTLSYALFGF